MSWIASLLLFLFAAVVSAEELIPSGTLLTLPDGKCIKLDQDSTIISNSEKEILVRNDDLWQSDRSGLEAAKKEIGMLKADQALAENQLELQKQAVDLERQKTTLAEQRAKFYKEQVEVISKRSKETIDQLNTLVKQSQPSAFNRFVSTAGWLAGILAVGIAIGLAL